MYHFTSFCISVFFSIQLMAQVPGIAWEKTYGGNSTEYGAFAKQTADGNYLIGGSTGTNNTSEIFGNHGLADIWLAKVNGEGTVLWSKCYGGSGGDYLLSMLLTDDGGALLLGQTESFDGDVVGNHGMNDGWVVKVSNDGTIEWKKCLGGEKDDLIKAAIPIASGGYVLVGDSQSLNGDLNGNHGGYDYWVVRLSNNGAVLWSKNYGGDQWDNAEKVIQTKDGGLLVVGSSESNTNDVTNNHGMRDIWMLKLDGIGNKLWQKCIGGTEEDVANAILENSDSTLVVAGYSLSNDGDASNNKGEGDYWLLKFTLSADIIWEKSYGGSKSDYCISLARAAFGGFVMAGWSESNDGDVVGNHGDFDYWLLRVDDTGTEIWKKCFGGSKMENLNSISSTSDNGYLIMGDSRSSNGDVGENQGYNDFWLVKLQPDNIVAGIKTADESTVQFRVFPNPATYFLTVSYEASEGFEYQLEVLNAYGKGMMVTKITHSQAFGELNLDISLLPSGMYSLVMKANDGRYFIGNFIKIQP